MRFPTVNRRLSAILAVGGAKEAGRADFRVV
jgi:hypothetical protein